MNFPDKPPGESGKLPCAGKALYIQGVGFELPLNWVFNVKGKVSQVRSLVLAAEYRHYLWGCNGLRKN